ncbi:hypothetical protein P7K49_003298 [Saguinus oedipus]|uniref:Uncharacterized protein n=1 Tax=Saguinus oedipus TaxID=9490 RepID=A0ABQ9WNV7_SAGOE|nr:hypothetical protein P7K49_003298 [Saguinus oedipus]
MALGSWGFWGPVGFLERWGTLAPQDHLAQQGSLGPSPNSSPQGALYSLQPPTDKDNGDSRLASAIMDTVLVGIPGPQGLPGPPGSKAPHFLVAAPLEDWMHETHMVLLE